MASGLRRTEEGGGVRGLFPLIEETMGLGEHFIRTDSPPKRDTPEAFSLPFSRLGEGLTDLPAIHITRQSGLVDPGVVVVWFLAAQKGHLLQRSAFTLIYQV